MAGCTSWTSTNTATHKSGSMFTDVWEWMRRISECESLQFVTAVGDAAKTPTWHVDNDNDQLCS